MRTIFILTVIFTSNVSLGQSKYNQRWVFNNHNNFIFENDSLIVDTISNPFLNLDPGDYPSNICDKKGDLLFYTGGCYVINKQNAIMQHGDSITSNFALDNWCGYNDFPMRQNNTILPYPKDSSKYVIFNLNIEHPLGSSGLPIPTQLYYHIVDMAGDNGLGAVTQKKQIILEDTLTRGYLQATRHANGTDWWVIAPEWNSNCYFIVPLTESGIGQYHRSCSGQVWGNGGGGQVTFSPNGKKYVRCNYTNGLWLFDFDNETGELSKPLELTFPVPTSNYRGVCFSPNSRFLYVAAYLQLFQFDMEAADIQASMQLVGEMDVSNPIQGGGSLAFSKLAPDGKIYIAGPGNHRYLSVINKPNCYGEMCDFQQWAIKLLAPNYGGLPNMPHFNTIESSNACESIQTGSPIVSQSLLIYPNPFQDFVHIEYDNCKTISYRISDTLGRLIQSETINGSSTNVILSKNLPNGVYFISVQIDDRFERTQKIIKT
jgi:hypothetical protein